MSFCFTRKIVVAVALSVACCFSVDAQLSKVVKAVKVATRQARVQLCRPVRLRALAVKPVVVQPRFKSVRLQSVSMPQLKVLNINRDMLGNVGLGEKYSGYVRTISSDQGLIVIKSLDLTLGELKHSIYRFEIIDAKKEFSYLNVDFSKAEFAEYGGVVEVRIPVVPVVEKSENGVRSVLLRVRNLPAEVADFFKAMMKQPRDPAVIMEMLINDLERHNIDVTVELFDGVMADSGVRFCDERDYEA